ncbi:MAG: phosphatidylserine decarboxylase family protein [Bacteroidota bacterium]
MLRIHKEGTRLILFVVIIAAIILTVFCLTLGISLWTGLTAIVILPFVFFIFYFFRNPKREIIRNDNEILAPADGKVVVIENVFEKDFLNQECIQISIFMSPLNVHLNRFPVSGKVITQKYFPGKYLVAWHPKSSELNERNVLILEDQAGRRYLVKQIAGAVARRIVWFTKENDTFQQGEEFGFIKLGSRVDILIPKNCNVVVPMNAAVKGGITVLARY